MQNLPENEESLTKSQIARTIMKTRNNKRLFSFQTDLEIEVARKPYYQRRIKQHGCANASTSEIDWVSGTFKPFEMTHLKDAKQRDLTQTKKFINSFKQKKPENKLYPEKNKPSFQPDSKPLKNPSNSTHVSYWNFNTKTQNLSKPLKIPSQHQRPTKLTTLKNSRLLLHLYSKNLRSKYIQKNSSILFKSRRKSNENYSGSKVNTRLGVQRFGITTAKEKSDIRVKNQRYSQKEFCQTSQVRPIKVIGENSRENTPHKIEVYTKSRNLPEDKTTQGEMSRTVYQSIDFRDGYFKIKKRKNHSRDMKSHYKTFNQRTKTNHKTHRADRLASQNHILFLKDNQEYKDMTSKSQLNAKVKLKGSLRKRKKTLILHGEHIQPRGNHSGSILHTYDSKIDPVMCYKDRQTNISPSNASFSSNERERLRASQNKFFTCPLERVEIIVRNSSKWSKNK
ncbi:unnamed protein product [Moneuplotes crassus]|uniref:Uncharacterized protein n=1 Tax=Euplotes crassus TaxID=5936 RepID=A0AAD2DAN1_EUPCR|nr:unnamed protein product [Moneuplotes crassus]